MHCIGESTINNALYNNVVFARRTRVCRHCLSQLLDVLGFYHKKIDPPVSFFTEWKKLFFLFHCDMANSAPKRIFTGKCMENVWKITVILRFLLSIFHTTSDWHMRLKDACPPSSRIQKPTLHEIRGLIIELTDPKSKLTDGSKSGKNWSLR